VSGFESVDGLDADELVWMDARGAGYVPGWEGPNMYYGLGKRASNGGPING
jgi:hypothetical protein